MTLTVRAGEQGVVDLTDLPDLVPKVGFTIEVTSLDGAKGKTLKLGHDEGGKPYDYWVTVFVAKKKVFIVEAGAPHELMEKAKPNVAWMLKSVRFK